MFRSARISLTAWYTLSILLVSLFFSLLFYRAALFEMERFERMQRNRLERTMNFPDDSTQQMPRFLRRGSIPPPDPVLLAEARSRVLWILAGINGMILFVGAGLGYVLAGRTLRPIQNMLNEQKRFVSDASHELRTPLTALKTTLEVFLRNRNHTLTDARTLASESLEDVSRLQLLTDSLLELVQSGERSPGKRESLSLRSILHSAERQIKPIAKNHAITLGEFGESVSVYGNRDELIRLFVILLDNAVKYSPDGGTISVDIESEARRVMIHVTDHGIGIDPRDLPHIFDRFYRADSARTSGSGFGLGLALAKQIAESHAGSISASSVPGAGTRLTVTLPRSATLQN